MSAASGSLAATQITRLFNIAPTSTSYTISGSYMGLSVDVSGLASGLTTSGTLWSASLSGGAFANGGSTYLGTTATATSFSQMIMGTVTISSGAGTYTNAAVTSNSTAVFYAPASHLATSSSSGVITPLVPVMRSGSISFTGAGTDTSVYNLFIVISGAYP